MTVWLGDYDFRGREFDKIFAATELTDAAIDAANRACAKFHPSFPGWEIYMRTLTGESLYDRKLEMWAITTARMLARARKKNGREYIQAAARSPQWIAFAGRDGVYHAVHGKFPMSLGDRSREFGIAPVTYQRVRDPIAGALDEGMRNFRGVLHAEYRKVLSEYWEIDGQF